MKAAATKEVGAAIAAVRRTARGAGDDDDDPAVVETRRLLREAGPDAVVLLRHAIRTDRGFASSSVRVRAAIAVLKFGEFAAADGVFGEPEDDGEAEAG